MRTALRMVACDVCGRVHPAPYCGPPRVAAAVNVFVLGVFSALLAVATLFLIVR
jgi:hypothetical protein